jgi:hypothetical protein
VTADGQGLVGHAGVRLLADLAERSGLEGALGTALRPLRQRRRRHEPGSVLVDLAVTLADGGDCLSDLQVLRNQPGLFGEVASQTTAWRVVEAIEQSVLERVQRARARARARVWKWGAAPGRATLDFDATLVKSYSEKEGAAPTYKQGFGFHPLLVHLDETREALAGRLRPGNAGANTAQDHVELLEEALAQLPLPTRKEDPERGLEVLVRADTAGATHGFVEAITGRGLEFSIGFDVTEPVRLAILKLPKSAWVDAIQQDLEPREGAWVAELTPCLDLSAWPAGTRAIGRREEPHPGAQFNLFDPDGYRHQVLITNSQDLDIAYLEARHRGHARVEDRIRWGKALGLENFPFSKFSSNSVWLMVVMLAQDLLAWAQRLCLEGPLASAEPKRLRYALWHIPGRLVRTARRLILRLDANSPWARLLAQAFQRLRSLPRF